MNDEEWLKEFKLSIGNIVIWVISDTFNPEFNVNEAYKHFISDGEPEITLHIHYGDLPECNFQRKIFDSGGIWSLYSSNRKQILRLCSPPSAPFPYKLAILKSDFKFGDIYIKSRENEERYYSFDYPLDEVLMINLLSKGRGVIIHACGVKDKGQGLLFVGTSQMGKSTIANLWKNENGATLLSDDRIIIRKKEEKFLIYGTPWHGDAKVCSPERAPLEKIFFLKHAKNNTIKKIGSVDAISRLIVCSFSTFWDKKGMEFTLKFCTELAERIPCYELGFVPDGTVLDFVSKV